MGPAGADTVEHTRPLPWMVGCLRAGGLALAHEMSPRDMAADTAFAANVLDLAGVAAGDILLLTSGSSEFAQIWPYEQALEARGACVAVAENLIFDAGRSEMFMRRLPIKVAFGIGPVVLDGMAAMGLDIQKAFSNTRLIVARDRAADRLAELGFSPWRMLSFGPVFGYVTAHGKCLYDRKEWLLEAPSGEILISARQARANPLVRFPTGVRGTVDEHGDFQLL